MTDLNSSNPERHGLLHERLAHWGGCPAIDLRLVVENGRDGFDEAQVQSLVGWIEAWRAVETDLRVAIAAQMACTPERRRWRLKGLRDLLQLLGIPRENIKYAELDPAASASPSRTEFFCIRRIDAGRIDGR